jgi:ABC-type uncharacterized transport system auxiliary subunit
MMRVITSICLVILLAGCGAPPPVPTDHFYRLVIPEGENYSASGLTGEVITVGAFLAEGLYNERALLYSRDNPSRELEQFHYHFWITSPPSLLRDYLVRLLRQAEISPMVITGVGPGKGLQITGRLIAFERQGSGDQPSANVILELRVDRQGDELPLLLREYSARSPIEGPAMTDVIMGFNAAADEIYSDFFVDLGKLLQNLEGQES